VDDRVDLRVGRAIDVLPAIEREGLGPFDVIFIDADKPGTPDYFAWALRLARVGTLIVIDNVVREGAVADGHSRDPAVTAMRRVLQAIASEPRVAGTVLQTVGGKGYDGFALVLVTS
jgi:predicted O-methyltransferase YrrM